MLGIALITAFWWRLSIDDEVGLPKRLEPNEGVAQCNYEILRAFTMWMEDTDPHVLFVD